MQCGSTATFSAIRRPPLIPVVQVRGDGSGLHLVDDEDMLARGRCRRRCSQQNSPGARGVQGQAPQEDGDLLRVHLVLAELGEYAPDRRKKARSRIHGEQTHIGPRGDESRAISSRGLMSALGGKRT